MSQPNIVNDAQSAVQAAAKADKSGQGAYEALIQQVQAELKKPLSAQQKQQYEQQVTTDLKNEGLLPEISLEYGKAEVQQNGGPLSYQQTENGFNPLSGDAKSDPILNSFNTQLTNNFSELGTRGIFGDPNSGSSYAITTSDLNNAVTQERAQASNRITLAPLFQEQTVNGKKETLLQYLDQDQGGAGDGQFTQAKLATYLDQAQKSDHTGIFNKANTDLVQSLYDGTLQIKDNDGKTTTLPQVGLIERGGYCPNGVGASTFTKACGLSSDADDVGWAGSSKNVAKDYNNLSTNFTKLQKGDQAGTDLETDAGGGGGGTDSKPKTTSPDTSNSQSAQAASDTETIDDAPDTSARNSSKTLMQGAIQGEYQKLQGGEISQKDFNQYLSDLKGDLAKSPEKSLVSQVDENGALAEQMGKVSQSAADSIADLSETDGTGKAQSELETTVNDAFQKVRDGKMSDTAYDEYISDLGKYLGADGDSQLNKDTLADSKQVEKLARQAAANAHEVESIPDNCESASKAVLAGEIQEEYKEVQAGTISSTEFKQYLSDLTSDLTKKKDDSLASDANADGEDCLTGKSPFDNSSTTDSPNTVVAKQASSEAKEVESAPGTNSENTPEAILKGLIDGEYEGVQGGAITTSQFDTYLSDLASDLQKAGHPTLASDVSTLAQSL